MGTENKVMWIRKDNTVKLQETYQVAELREWHQECRRNSLSKKKGKLLDCVGPFIKVQSCR